MTKTLLDCYNQHKGEAILIPGGGKGNNGQCAQWADTVLYEVYGLPYIYTPNALDWWYDAEDLGLTNNFNKIAAGQPIKTGDFVVYGTGVGSKSGHINVASKDGSYKDFWAYDSNWGGPAFYNSAGYPILHEVHHNDGFNQYIVGYLRRKEDNMPTVFNPDGSPVTQAQYDDAAHYKPIAIDAQPYKDAVVASKAWTGDIGQKVDNITPVLNDLQQYKIDHSSAPGGVNKNNVLDYINKNLK